MWTFYLTHILLYCRPSFFLSSPGQHACLFTIRHLTCEELWPTPGLHFLFILKASMQTAALLVTWQLLQSFLMKGKYKQGCIEWATTHIIYSFFSPPSILHLASVVAFTLSPSHHHHHNHHDHLRPAGPLLQVSVGFFADDLLPSRSFSYAPPTPQSLPFSLSLFIFVVPSLYDLPPRSTVFFRPKGVIFFCLLTLCKRVCALACTLVSISTCKCVSNNNSSSSGHNKFSPSGISLALVSLLFYISKAFLLLLRKQLYFAPFQNMDSISYHPFRIKLHSIPFQNIASFCPLLKM